MTNIITSIILGTFGSWMDCNESVILDDIYMLGGEAPPNICRQKHGHTKKESSIKKQNMKSTSEIMVLYGIKIL
jgi:hypothetical protein